MKVSVMRVNGKIKTYNNSKGFGFIRDENGEDRFFHITDVQSDKEPQVQQLVEFRPSNNAKGLSAVGIQLKGTPEPQAYVLLGNKRVKASNIKEYGVVDNRTYHQKVYYEENSKLNQGLDIFLLSLELLSGSNPSKSLDPVNGATHFFTEISQQQAKLLREGKKKTLFSTRQKNNRIYESSTLFAKSSELLEKGSRYLYVTTYQRDNYTIYEKIDETLQELDRLLNHY